MTHYIGLIDRDQDSYGIVFPDFPGCVSVGQDLDSCFANGIEALAFHFEALQKDGDPIAPPRSLQELQQDPDFLEEAKGSIIVAVPLLAEIGRKARVNITLDHYLLEAIDRTAKSLHLTRSAFLAGAAREALKGEGAKLP